MTASACLEVVDRVDDLETHIDSLLRQKEILESIEQYAGNKLDFGDFLETYQLLVEEIERLQERLGLEKQEGFTVFVGERCFEEEEEEGSSFSSKYRIEHVVRDESGRLRRVKPEDLDMSRHEGVRDAFKLIYGWQRDYKPCEEYEEEEEEEGDEEGETSSNRFDIENRLWFLELVKERGKA